MTEAKKGRTTVLLPLLLAAALTGSFIRPFGQPAEQPTAQSALLAALAAAPCLWALLSLYAGATARRQRPVWFSLLLAAALLLSAGMELAQCLRFYNHVLAEQLPVLCFLLLALGVAAVAAARSIRALDRAALLILAILGGSLVLLAVSVAPQMRTENLLYAAQPARAFAHAFGLRFALLPEYLLLPLLGGPANPGEARRGYGWLLGLSFGLEGLLTVLSEAVLGQAAARQSQPVYTIARLGGVSVFRRLDAVHVAVWLLLFFLRVGLYLWAILWLVRGPQPSKQTAAGSALGAAAILIVFGCLWLCPAAQYAYLVQQGLLWLLLGSLVFWRKRR